MSKMDWIFGQVTLRPVEFERAVKAMLEAAGADLDSFECRHLEKMETDDGTYQVDISVRFSAMDASFLVLVECKHQKRPVEREDVQILNDRLRSTGAQKGIIFSTSGFQSGAVQYAAKHGIGLAKQCEEQWAWMTKSEGGDSGPFAQSEAGARFIGYLIGLNEAGTPQYQIASPDEPKYIRRLLRLTGSA